MDLLRIDEAAQGPETTEPDLMAFTNAPDMKCRD
jgi:hypothetical protein